MELRSGDGAAVAKAVGLPVGQAPAKDFVDGLHGLRDLQFEPSAFRDFGDGTAQTSATVTPADGPTAVWTVYLVLDAGRWKLSATAPQ